MTGYMDKKHPLDIALDYAISGDLDKSEEILKSLPPDDPRVVFNLGTYAIRRGYFKEGHRYLDSGRYIGCFGNRPVRGDILRPTDDVNGMTILLRLEGGYGDQICGFRFANYLTTRGANIVVSCSEGLESLFRSHGHVAIHSDYADGVFKDKWVPAMSAVTVFDMRPEDIPITPYITPECPKVFDTDKLKVGIRWAGNPQFEHQQFRKFPPELLIGLSDTPGVEFYSLQRDNDLIDNLPFTDLRDEMGSWKDTANIIAGLDLIITSDTSVAHLAAAMGKPVWNILPILPYYLYAIPGDQTPWYPTMKLYRQTKFGEWGDVFDKIRVDLSTFSLDT